MVKLWFVLAVVALCGAGWLWDTYGRPQGVIDAVETMRSGEAAVRGVAAPDVRFEDVSGTVYERWVDVSGEEILVHFWASWCGECKAEMPGFLRHVAGDSGRTAVMVSVDDERAAMDVAVARFRQQMPALVDAPNVMWVHDAGKVVSLKTFGTVGVPETVVLDAQRRMVDKVVGAGEWGVRSKEWGVRN